MEYCHLLSIGILKPVSDCIQCALLASGLKDNVELHFDDKGNVVGIHYFTESSSCDVVLEDDVAPVSCQRAFDVACILVTVGKGDVDELIVS